MILITAATFRVSTIALILPLKIPSVKFCFAAVSESVKILSPVYFSHREFVSRKLCIHVGEQSQS